MSSSSDSGSDLDVADAEMMLMGTSRTKKKQPASQRRKAPAKRAKVIVESDEEDEDSDDDVFTHKYNEDLYVDEEDRKYLEGLTELERELELNRRNEEREKAKQRWEMEREIKRKAKRQQAAARRKSPRRTRAQPTVASEDEEEDLDETQGAGYVDEEEAESDYEAEIGGNQMVTALEEEEEIEPQKDETPATLEQLESIRATRTKLLEWCHEAHFPETAAGMMVRINLGESQPGVSTYRLGQIVRVEEKRLYELRDGRERTKTRFYVLVQHGRSRRPFRMSFVSNGPILQKEFMKWQAAIEKDNMAFPTADDVSRKRAELEALKTRVRTGEDILYTIESKRKCECATTNLAREIDGLRLEMHRVQASKEEKEQKLSERRAALRQEENYDDDDVAEDEDEQATALRDEIQALTRRETDIVDTIDRLERKKQSEAERRRANTFDTNKLNERNIRAEKLQRKLLSERTRTRDADDVFQRRRAFSKKGRNLNATSNAKGKDSQDKDKIEGGADSSSAASQAAAEGMTGTGTDSDANAGGQGAQDGKQEGASATTATATAAPAVADDATKKSANVTDLHNFQLEGVELPDIDVSADLMAVPSLVTPSMPAPVSASLASSSSSSSTAASKGKKSGRRGLNLKAYKKKHGLV
ncbi:hypothetical protein PTSG_02413 [Salpingoeca rosetta]|uniref:Plus3 domain-containing protein n=1 Tax=Salpingoeca rosetta (strain ATCC 50818 / BSB-021) TaxID=946362 RepID=F2U248_SALR5|nr:uncharacterized protein PTSG_02413 [Salpingoeca rosetta]EGD81700.1 hypothetical protein PTSG_02413 [Salpingoeca rosetta]|eukprot:XP_004996904.1 hypothetical protein PTSG_02413 [Salpingoeca rosetta]